MASLLRWATLALALTPSTALLAARDDGTAKPWELYIQSPTSRTISPKSIYAIKGDALVTLSSAGEGDEEEATEPSYILTMNPGAQITLDFGYVGGLLSLKADTKATTQQFSLAFAESPAFVRAISDDTGAVHTQDYDKQLNVTVAAGTTAYKMPTERFRGGFKYVTIVAYEAVTISDITNIGPPFTSRFLPQVKDGWAYNASLGVEGPMMLDGAKRDRAVWPGDLGVAGTTAYLGLGAAGLESIYYAIETMFFYQNKTTGQTPFAGPTTGSWRNGALSDTYHAWTMIACYNYAIFTGDAEWVDRSWGNMTAGLEYIYRAVDNKVGLANQAFPNDWARLGGGGYNSALNALDYHALFALASLAADTATKDNGRAEQAKKWATAAAKLKEAFNEVLWDDEQSLYRDNETDRGALLFPQDGNALAVYYNLTVSSSQQAAISNALAKRWNAIGPLTPELPDTISSFISSIEVLAHFTAGKAATGLKLVRRMWGYMLDSPLMTGTTLIEGMSANGSLYYRSQRSYRYDAAYTSLSHSWSTGPTQALSFKAVGLEVVSWGRWVFKPLPGDLTSLRSGWTSPLGDWEAIIEIEGEGGGRKVAIELVTPEKTRGEIVLPWHCVKVTVDGETYDGSEVEGGGRKVIRGKGCRLSTC
ncbi:hypothetical protein VdG1_03590 [Verticillium dahliae VDG1]|nr:hypothetical protein VdG1_03590 [Verticillium dahliae VDG1]